MRPSTRATCTFLRTSSRYNNADGRGVGVDPPEYVAFAPIKWSPSYNWSEVEMAKVGVSIVHDELGRILSIARPSKDARVVVLSGNGPSVFVTQADEEIVSGLVDSHRVGLDRNSLVEG
jgi:hypothetical protein